VLTLFAGRLVQIQGMEAGYYREVAKKQTFEAIPLPAMRGTIYGADGQVLAMTVETYTVTADPPQIADKPRAAQELAGPLGLTQQQVLNLLEHPTSKDYVVLAKGVSAPNQTKIAALNIPGVASLPAYARDYPDGDATANVVGFTNVNPATGVIAGQTGLEQEYNKLLSGTPGSEQVEIGADPAGRQQGHPGAERHRHPADDHPGAAAGRAAGVRGGSEQDGRQAVHRRDHPAEDRRHPRHGAVADL
jgi:cell division protein FtsI (penicillin-binding protein 3)